MPGLVSKISEDIVASAATIYPKNDMILVSGTTDIATIVPPYAGFSGILILVPTAGAVALLTTGNIAVAVTCAQNRATPLFYSKLNNTWYPGGDTN